MRTLSEEILGASAGEYVDREVDHAFAHDGTGVLTLEAWKEMEVNTIARPENLHILFDHITPANNSTTAALQHEIRDFAHEQGIHFSDIGGGICHQIMSEGIIRPGDIVVGADSHSCTGGAFGAFATGVGATDMAAIWASGSTWFRVPETVGINLTGKLSGAVEAKDIALTYVGRLGMDGGTYKALEFTGDGISPLSMEDRLTLSNMAVETGAKTGLFYADSITRKYLLKFGCDAEEQAVPDCTYSSEITIDLDSLEPVLSVPHRVDTIAPVEKFSGTELDVCRDMHKRAVRGS